MSLEQKTKGLMHCKTNTIYELIQIVLTYYLISIFNIIVFDISFSIAPEMMSTSAL